MTFLEEELQTLENSPEYKRFLKVFIKYQIYTLFQKLSDIGEESFALTANPCDGTFSHVGSSKGEVFLDKTQDLQWKFLSFCSSTDNSPESYGVTPVSSEDMHHSQGENVTYTDEESGVLQQQESRVYSAPKQRAVFQNEDVRVYTEPEDEGNGLYEDHTDSQYSEEQAENYGEKTTSRRLFMKDGHVWSPFGQNQSSPDTFLTSQQGSADAVDMNQLGYIIQTFKGKDDEQKSMAVINVKREPPDSETESTAKYDEENIMTDEKSKSNKNNFGRNVLKTRVGRTKNNGSSTTPIQATELSMQFDNHDQTFGLKCSVCERSFPSPRKLDRHMKRHGKTTNLYQCTVCSKSFSQTFNLRRHMMIHTGEKPFECGICSKRFNQKVTRDEHQNSHLNLRPHQCPVCQKGFNARCSMIGHWRRCSLGYM